MKFENFELFPQVVTRYHYDDEKTLEIHEICKEIVEKIGPGDSNYNENNADPTLKHYYNNAASSILHTVPEFKEFKLWSEECARHFMTEVLDYIIDNDVPIITTDSWMNVAGERTGQLKHNHHNSLVSGTFYVYRSEWVHSGIEFYRPHVELYPRISHRTKSEHEDDQLNKYKRNLETLYPSTGDLLLWSSEMLHGYYGITNFMGDRTSISMNYLPQTVNNGKYSFTIKENGE